jgi:hypothetical protein
MAHDHTHPHTVEELEETLHAHDDWFRHDAAAPHHQQPHGETKAWGILGFMAATLVFVLVVGYASFFLWEDWTRAQSVKVFEGQTKRSEYLSLRADWQKRLTSYEWADAAKGTVHIPIDQAKKQVAAYYAAKKGSGAK